MHILKTLTALTILLFLSLPGFGQETVPDTLSNNNADSVYVTQPTADTVTTTDTLPVPQPQGDIQTTINYTATDSIRFNVLDRIINLYGDAYVDYGEIELTAEKIKINWNKDLVTATGAYDTTGKLVGKPVFKEGQDEFEADTIRYNIATRKGVIVQAVTQEGEGYIHAESGVKDENNNLYFRDAKYTTCNHADPHFYIGANRLKVIPEDKVVSGPFNLYVADIPTPLGFVLGFFPIPEKRTSGIIFPSDFGEHSTRGFYFTQAGYYLAVGDYAGVGLRGDLYSNGSWRTTLSADYKKRYSFNGAFNFNYSRLREGFDPIGETNPTIPQWNLFWRHASDTRGSSRFSASVNVASGGYYRNFSYNPTSIITTTLESNVSYNTAFRNTPFNLGVSLRQSQNLQTGVAQYTLPSINFSMNRIYPFKRKIGSKNTWYENINFNYDLNTGISFTNTPTPLSRVRERGVFAQEEVEDTVGIGDFERLFNRATYGAVHNVNLQTSIKPKKTFLKYFSINPSINYQEFWYPGQIEYQFVDSVNTFAPVNFDQGFRRTYQYSGLVNLNTWLYGTYLFSGKLRGIRHSINPTVGFSYRPDFANPVYGNYIIETDTLGREQQVSVYEGVYSGVPAAGESGSITFSVNNILEAKILTSDTVNPTKKIKLLDRFGFSGFYNLAADSFQLSNLNLYANTRLLGIFDIRFNATLDPYGYVTDSTYFTGGNRYVVEQTRQRTLAIADGRGLGQLNRYNLSIGANLSPQAFKRKVVPANADPMVMEHINAHPNLYVDFTLPWTLSLNYIYGVSRTGFQSASVNHTISFTGDLKLTDNWKIGFQSGYDIKGNGIPVTRLEIFRDLHCWQMSLSTVLFSTQQSYMFSIRPKAGILQDLKLSKRSPGSFGQPPLF